MPPPLETTKTPGVYIVPGHRTCARQRARMPTHLVQVPRLHRAQPESEDGTWYSPRFSTQIYRCVDRRGNCPFRNTD